MEKFVLAGKAKTVFQIIELMARGEMEKAVLNNNNRQLELALDNSFALWPRQN